MGLGQSLGLERPKGLDQLTFSRAELVVLAWAWLGWRSCVSLILIGLILPKW